MILCYNSILKEPMPSLSANKLILRINKKSRLLMLKKIKKKLLLKTDRDKVPQQRRIKIKNLKWRNKDLRKLLTRETMRLKLKTMLSSKIHRRLVSLKDSKSITNLPSISSLAFLLLLLWELPCLLSPYS